LLFEDNIKYEKMKIVYMELKMLQDILAYNSII